MSESKTTKPLAVNSIPADSEAPLLAVRDLSVHFPVQGKERVLRAVDQVSFSVNAGETLGIVGESGCGKSTLARAILRLGPLTEGEIIFNGQDISQLSAKKMRPVRRDLQVVFQDPLASLNPRRTAGELIAEPLQVLGGSLTKAVIQTKVREIMAAVGLSPRHINGYPHEFSGGQCQRIGIARALILQPKLIICDEPVSALDVSIQAQIINLLMQLQREFGLTLVFIAHDLSVVKHISNRILVMRAGQRVELGTREQIYDQPQAEYTQQLLSAVPIPDPVLQRKRLAELAKAQQTLAA